MQIRDQRMTSLEDFDLRITGFQEMFTKQYAQQVSEFVGNVSSNINACYSGIVRDLRE